MDWGVPILERGLRETDGEMRLFALCGIARDEARVRCHLHSTLCASDDSIAIREECFAAGVGKVDDGT